MMKLHLCFMNWSEWSAPVQGYDYKIQVRKCLVCNKENHRRVGWAGQADAHQLEEAMKTVGGANNE